MNRQFEELLKTLPMNFGSHAEAFVAGAKWMEDREIETERLWSNRAEELLEIFKDSEATEGIPLHDLQAAITAAIMWTYCPVEGSYAGDSDPSVEDVCEQLTSAVIKLTNVPIPEDWISVDELRVLMHEPLSKLGKTLYRDQTR